MLKWAVYGKKNQDIKLSKEYGKLQPFTNEAYTNHPRRSLDAQTVKKSKKPSRYQRRSLGSTAIRKSNLKPADDKENVNYIGNTPNYFKEGFVPKKSDISFALKDVSNITPTSTPTKSNLQKQKYHIGGAKDAIPPDLPPTPPTYSRKIREAKKRKLEMTSVNNNDNNLLGKTNIESSLHVDQQDRTSILSHSQSEPSLNKLSDRLELNKGNSRNSIAITRSQRNVPISTTKTSTQCLVEIEYDQNLIINCIEQPILEAKKKFSAKHSTLPIFGHHIFKNKPLYFNKNDLDSEQRISVKRVRRTSNENSNMSPLIDQKDLHTLVREACSPISLTPLSVKLAGLRFSTLSTHTKSQRIIDQGELTEFLPKIDNTFSNVLRDEETSTEMENKFILCKDSVNNVTETTVSTTEMGDLTLEKMIEDIIKSTRKVKTKRRILHNNFRGFEMTDDEKECLKVNQPNDFFIESQAENKVSQIREAKYISLSRESSLSPINSPNKKNDQYNRRNNNIYKSLSNMPMGTFVLDEETEYNEREVKTPEHFILHDHKCKPKITLERSQSMYSTDKVCNIKENFDCISSESTPDLHTSLQRNSNSRLRRQRCIRRKKSTLSNESSWRKHQSERKSMLTLDNGIPSPCASDINNISICDPLSSSFNCIMGPPYRMEPINSSPKSIISNTSLFLRDGYSEHNKRSRELFGLTLENGIPSPITPILNLKRPSCNLSEERAHKTSKLDDDIKMTPVIEHKSSRRCLTFSSEEASIDSSEENRRSIASNRLERSYDKIQPLKATIDLEILVRNTSVDVHGE